MWFIISKETNSLLNYCQPAQTCKRRPQHSTLKMYVEKVTKTQHGIDPHLKCAWCILQSHRPKCVPPVAKETQSITRLGPLPPATPPPPSMWTSGLSMTWNKSRWWKNTVVIGASSTTCQSQGVDIKYQRRCDQGPWDSRSMSQMNVRLTALH